MEEMIKQRETLNTSQQGDTVQRIVGIVFGAIEITLAFRLVFKLLGANPENGFVQGIYAFTHYFVVAFVGIFSRSTTQGSQTLAVFEPATVIAMVVVALIAWAVLKMSKPHTGNHVERTEYTNMPSSK